MEQTNKYLREDPVILTNKQRPGKLYYLLYSRYKLDLLVAVVYHLHQF